MVAKVNLMRIDGKHILRVFIKISGSSLFHDIVVLQNTGSIKSCPNVSFNSITARLRLIGQFVEKCRKSGLI